MSDVLWYAGIVLRATVVFFLVYAIGRNSGRISKLEDTHE